MHLYPVAMDQYPDEFTDDATQVSAAYPGIVLFGKPMERRVFARASDTSSRDDQRVEPAGGLAAREDKNTSAAAPAGGAPAIRPAGMRLEWTRFIGGSGDESLGWQASPPAYLGRDGMLWLTGVTKSRDFPTTPDGLYPTYLGGKGTEVTSWIGSLAYDGHSRVYATGTTTSRRFPVTPDALQATHHGGRDAFLLAFNVADNSLAYGSYLGGSKNDGAYLALDENGALYLFGGTDSDDFPTLEKTPAPRKGRDLYIAKFTLGTLGLSR